MRAYKTGLACCWLAVVVVLSACQSPSVPELTPTSTSTSTSTPTPAPGATVANADGLAVAAHPAAAAAGRTVLEQGGNAVDAAIAMGFAIAVVEPTMNSIGGRSQVLLRTPGGRFHAVDGMTEIPAAYEPPATPVANGYGVIATPGVVAALGRLHAEYGSLPWATLLAPAIELAEVGYRLLPGAAARHAYGLKAVQDDPGFQVTYLKPEGSTYAEGEQLQQPILAMTLRLLAAAGADDFYRGEIAQRIASDMAAHGGHIRATDLAAYEALDGRIVTTDYRGYQVHSMAAPGGGGLIIKALNILENFDLTTLSDTAWAAVVSQALSLTLNSLAEDYAEQNLERVMSKAWARETARQIAVPAMQPVAGTSTGAYLADVADRQTRSTAHDWTGSSWGSASHHTTHFVASDCDGMVVSITQTLGPLFGAKVVTPDLGFVYASTMGTYLPVTQQAPGTRPRTTIAPTIVTRDGEVVMVLGAAGGQRILSGIVQTISRSIDRGLSLDAAVAAPRIHPWGQRDAETGVTRFNPRRFYAETTVNPGWSDDQLARWKEAGFIVEPNARAGAFSRVHALQRTKRGWNGTADPDWEGMATGARTSRCATTG